MAVEIITSHTQQCDSNGDPMSGAKIYVYDVGTTTPRDISASTTLSPTASNPIVCDSSGRHDMRYTATGSYKIVVKTSADVTVWTRDNIDGRVPVGSGALAIANGGTGATSAGAAVTALGAATAASVAAVAADVASLAGTLTAVDKTHIATGTTAQRPVSPVDGDIRLNTTVPQYEGYYNSTWLHFMVLGDVATQADQETATSTTLFVSPGRQKYHPMHPKAYGQVVSNSLVSSIGITSVSKDSNGVYTVTMSTAMSSGNYAVLPGIVSTSAGATLTIGSSNKGTTTFKIRTYASGTPTDNDFDFAVMGDQ